ncbi:LysR family transcriptional regulator [Nocardia australiensis]|uniref:LysR family transcriptional regulator n=1 Tax=Nocardia australiensis TaxID=2887191 RepID=UPI001D14FDD4|nr:LysR family transcriptional regulator [Nocardia australiensis]
MILDVRDLELLDALAAGGTLQQAADRLFVSQPALSQRLLRMEERLGTAVFDRIGRRLVPNQAGTQLLSRASRILADLAAAEREVRDIARFGDRHLRLAAQCATNVWWLAAVMRDMRKADPDVVVGLRDLGSEDPLEALLTHELDVAVITKLTPLAEHARLTHLMDDEMRAVVAPTHPWAARTYVTASDFTPENLILYDHYDQTRRDPLPLPIPPGARPASVSIVPTLTELVVELVAGGEGVGVLPSWVVAPYVKRGEVATVRVGRRGDHRSWFAAIRVDDDRPHLVDFVARLQARFAQETARSE